MLACLGRRSPFRRLQGAQQVTMFSQVEDPPFERGMTWSTVSEWRSEPQYWHAQRSRANTARRVILRRWASRGTRMYVTSRITTGRGTVRLSEWSAHSPCSMTSARSFSTSTVARRTVHTLIGSYEAFSTSTRPVVLRGPTNLARRIAASRVVDVRLTDMNQAPAAPRRARPAR